MFKVEFIAEVSKPIEDKIGKNGKAFGMIGLKIIKYHNGENSTNFFMNGFIFDDNVINYDLQVGTSYSFIGNLDLRSKKRDDGTYEKDVFLTIKDIKPLRKKEHQNNKDSKTTENKEANKESKYESTDDTNCPF